ncbi:MAG: hypothetical protein ACRBDL_01900 [Alphaproteobacteria bacterium]
MTKHNKQQKVRTYGGPKIGILLVILMLGYFLTPIPQYVFSFIPDHWATDFLADRYQAIILSEETKAIDTPQKLTLPSSLLVLGEQSGICFYFHSTTQSENRAVLNTEQMDIARRTGIIAEIIAVDSAKKEFRLGEGSFKEFEYEEDKPYSVICQKFSREYSLLPDQVSAIYIRPLPPHFTPYRISWETIKTIR